MRFKGVLSHIIMSVMMAIMLLTMLPFSIGAEEKSEPRTVRVGFFVDMPYLMTEDEKTGQRSGYGYEYLQMIANYTNWQYEYVYGEWYELWNMFIAGEIDLLEDISYTEERAEHMLFPDYTMGTERYQLYVVDPKSDIDPLNLKVTLAGKKIGVTAETYQETLLHEWVEQQGFNCKIVSFQSDFTRNEAMRAGELDGVVELEASSEADWEPIVQVGYSDYYIALSLGNEAMLAELNEALAAIEMVNPQYKQELYFKFFADEVISSRLTAQEKNWVETHDMIRVGYLVSEEASSKKGMLAEYIGAALDSLGISDSIAIQYVGFTNFEDMSNALTNEEVDLIFPTYRDEYLAEREQLSIVAALDRKTLRTVTKKGADPDNGNARIGICGGDELAYFITKYYQVYNVTRYDTQREVLDAVIRGNVDVAILDEEGLDTLLDSSRKYMNLVVSGTENSYYRCLSCKRGDSGLYMLLSRGFNLTSQDTLTGILDSYNRVESHYSWRNFFMNNIVYIILGVLLIAAIIVLVIVLDSTKKSKTFQKISETDSLTGILNRSGEKKIRRLMTTDMGGMFCLLDIDNFKAINDGFGHGAGDQVLIAVADCMNRVFRERDIVMRLGGDEFAVYVPRVTDEEIGTAIVDRFVTEVDRLRIEAIDNQPIHISLGATFYRVEEGKDYETIYKRADTGCYNSKKMQGRSEYTFVLG